MPAYPKKSVKYLRCLPPSSHQRNPTIPAKKRQIPNASKFLAQNMVNSRHTINMMAAPFDAVTLNPQKTNMPPRSELPK